eukprot:gene2559-3313_t
MAFGRASYRSKPHTPKVDHPASVPKQKRITSELSSETQNANSLSRKPVENRNEEIAAASKREVQNEQLEGKAEATSREELDPASAEKERRINELTVQLSNKSEQETTYYEAIRELRQEVDPLSSEQQQLRQVVQDIADTASLQRSHRQGLKDELCTLSERHSELQSQLRKVMDIAEAQAERQVAQEETISALTADHNGMMKHVQHMVGLLSRQSEAHEVQLRRLTEADATQKQQLQQLMETSRMQQDQLQREQQTALHWAASHGRSEVIRSLIQAGANVEAKDVDLDTALHWAAMNGHTDTVQSLIEAEADLEARDLDTPLNAEQATQQASRVDMQGDHTLTQYPAEQSQGGFVFVPKCYQRLSFWVEMADLLGSLRE